MSDSILRCGLPTCPRSRATRYYGCAYTALDGGLMLTAVASHEILNYVGFAK